MASKPNEAYTVGWICAISTEQVAAAEFLDKEHGIPEEVSQHDNNDYILGEIGKHNVVIAVLPDGEYGTVSAASVARDMLHSFPSIRIGLMVGIGGGAPSADHDIRLGDVVVGLPRNGSSGVFQYDFGKTIQGQEFQATRVLDQPPTVLRTAVNGLRTHYQRKGSKIREIIQKILDKNPRLREEYDRPDQIHDILYQSNFTHADPDDSCTASCGNGLQSLVVRAARKKECDDPMIHYGLVASGDQLMKDATVRDRLSAAKNVLCFEMEAAGLMNHFPCLVIRGICDYADSHKNKKWQGYAAMTAAGYAKDLLMKIAPNRVESERKIAELVSEVHDLAVESNANVAKLVSRSRNERIEKWLSAVDPSVDYQKALESRHPGTGQWFLQTPRYSQWKQERRQEEASFLWLFGKPGCGKTILSSTVIEDLKRDTNTTTVLYFFFAFSDNNKQTLESALRSLSRQLYNTGTPHSRDALEKCFVSHDKGRHQPSLDSLLHVFQEMIRQEDNLWVVLDALDECPNNDRQRDKLLNWIKDVSASNMNIRLLATSRPENDIETSIKEWACDDATISLQNVTVQEDISSYVYWEVRHRRGLRSRCKDKPIMKEIESSLTKKADGMFRWVSCQLDTLEGCLTPSAIAQALKSLPMTLDETYSRILTSLEQCGFECEARRILQFLAFSERPMQIKEVAETITIDTTKKPWFDKGRRVFIPEEISRYCGSLVTVVRIKGGYHSEVDYSDYSDYSDYIYDGGNGTNEHKTGLVLQLAHFSVKEYLLSNMVKEPFAAHLQAGMARAMIAETCLAYLLELDSQPIDEQSIVTLCKAYPLAKYAARYWADHAVAAGREHGSVHKLAMELLSNRCSFLTCCRLYNPDRRRSREMKYHELYYASLNGLHNCVQDLLNQSSDFNAQGGYYGNALQAASMKGHLEIVEVLLKAGADVNVQGGYYGNALQAASETGYFEIVEMLLKAGADVNVQSGYYGTALQAASKTGYFEIVEVLLKAGADVNVQGGYYGNALQAASKTGHFKIVEVLLKAGADVNVQGGYDGNAFQAASMKGHLEIVEMLLKAGADVNVQGGYYNTALQAASETGHFEIVEVLLKAGAEVSDDAINNTKHGKIVDLLRERMG